MPLLRTMPFAVLLVITALQPSECPGEKIETILHQNRLREYHLYVPTSYTGNEPVPLVIAFHGFTATGVGFRKDTGLGEIAEREGFIAVFPYALDGTWHVRGFLLGVVDDIDFADTLITHVSDQFNIDPRRIYATGMSQGGFVVQQMACELSHRVAAIAPVASATIPERVAELCQPPVPTAYLGFHGTQDITIPIEGRDGFLTDAGLGVPVMSVAETTEFWRLSNGCGPGFEDTNLPNRDPADGTAVRERTYIDCPDGLEVTVYTIIGGGHTWPGSARTFGNGRNSREIVASEIIWDFFSQHTLP